jgi:hypothetical protein
MIAFSVMAQFALQPNWVWVCEVSQLHAFKNAC